MTTVAAAAPAVGTDQHTPAVTDPSAAHPSEELQRVWCGGGGGGGRSRSGGQGGGGRVVDTLGKSRTVGRLRAVRLARGGGRRSARRPQLERSDESDRGLGRSHQHSERRQAQWAGW